MEVPRRCAACSILLWVFGPLISHGAQSNEVLVDGARAVELADRFGTPLYVYSASTIREAHASLRSVLPARTELFFSVKANPNPAIVSLLAGLGAGAEVASAGELDIAIRAGLSPSRILFAGPGKSDAELSLAVRSAIRSVNVESLGEAKRLSALSLDAKRRTDVAVRVNPKNVTSGLGLAMAGGPLPFGVDEEDLPEVLRQIDHCRGLSLRGLHLYPGTQVLDANFAAESVRTAAHIAAIYTETLKRQPERVFVGPGLGVPTFAGDGALDLDAFGRAALDAMGEQSAGALALEAGRFFVAGAGVYIATIVDVKVSRGVTFAIADGGMNHHAVATGGFGNVFRRPLSIVPAERRPGGTKVTLVGPCCTTLDRFAQDLDVGDVRVGDRIVVLASGAYGFSVSPIAFLSRESAAEVLVDGERARCIRERRATAALFCEGSGT